jgi:CRP/FNR family transcriptional regulator
LNPCYLFQGLSESQLQASAAITREIRIQKGQWLLHEGQEAKELYVLNEGAVELVTKAEGNFEIPIAIMRKPGDCFGTSALFPPHVYSLSARCVQEGTLLVIKRADLQKLILEDRDLGCTIMTNLAQNLLARLKETRQELKIHFKTLLKSMHS